MSDCVFCKIVSGEVPSYKVAEDSSFLAFLDAFPTMKGQIVVVPKKHLSKYVFDMSDFDYLDLMKFTKRVALAMDEAFASDRTGVVIEGLEVDHVHVRLYPLFKHSGLDLKSEVEISREEMKSIANKISLCFA